MTAIISKHGELLQLIYANAETIALNKPVGCLAVSDPPQQNMYYRGYWITLPPAPSHHHKFDYERKEWIDYRSLDDVKTQQWNMIKFERDLFEFGGFEFESKLYDSDQVSQGRIMGAAVAGVDQIWTLADNSTIELTALQLTQLYQALQLHIAYAHERGRIARQLIQDAETVEGVESIVF